MNFEVSTAGTGPPRWRTVAEDQNGDCVKKRWGTVSAGVWRYDEHCTSTGRGEVGGEEEQTPG